MRCDDRKKTAQKFFIAFFYLQILEFSLNWGAVYFFFIMLNKHWFFSLFHHFNNLPFSTHYTIYMHYCTLVHRFFWIEVSCTLIWSAKLILEHKVDFTFFYSWWNDMALEFHINSCCVRGCEYCLKL